MRRPLRWGLAALAGFASFACGAQLVASPMARLPETMAAPAVQDPRLLLSRQEIRAQLMPRRYTTLAAEIGAKINSLPYQEGAAFKSGEQLVSFDCSLQQAQLEKARAELESAQYTLKSNQRLAELNSVGLLELDLSRAAASKARAEVGWTQAMLAKCAVPAPFSGRIAELKARDQQFVQPGQALMDIIDDSVLELEFLVPSAWLSWIRVGGALRVQIDETRKTYPARFIRIAARVDPVSQSVKLVAEIEGKHEDLVAGMSGRVLAAPPVGGSRQLPLREPSR